MNVKVLAKSVGAVMKKNAPKILTGASVGGSLVTIILTAKATNKAKNRLNDIKECYTSEGAQEPTLNKKEIVKATWKYYIPVAISFAATTACTICSNVESNKREMAAMALYSTAQKAFDEYKDIAKKELGEEKAKELEEKLSAVTMDRDGVMETGRGAYLFQDTFTGQYFRSSPEIVTKAFELFDNMLECQDCQVNELYSLLGWPPKRLPDVGQTHYFIKEDVDGAFVPCFDSGFSDTGEPCYILYFPYEPVYKK